MLHWIRGKKRPPVSNANSESKQQPMESQVATRLRALRYSCHFSEWSPVNGGMLKRRDFMLSFLVEKQHQMLLFSDEANDN
ncbi:MAG: hypothetical protein M0036_06670 [Desulfobacteraceae bacterium]|nr:hypothetical protein [Desulfobacteraceae bacterium]